MIPKLDKRLLREHSKDRGFSLNFRNRITGTMLIKLFYVSNQYHTINIGWIDSQPIRKGQFDGICNQFALYMIISNAHQDLYEEKSLDT